MTNAQKLKEIMAKNLKYYLDRKGISQTDLAKELNIPETTMSNWLKAKTYPRVDKIQVMADYFNIRRSDLTEEKSGNKVLSNLMRTTEYPYVHLPVSAGLPLCIDSIDEDDLEYISIPDNLMGKWAGRDIFMMRVNGDSMNRVVTHGSLIGVKPTPLEKLKNGDIVVYSDGGDYAVKRFHQRENKIIFRPDSTDDMFSDYETTTDNSDLKIHGKVVMYLVELD